MRTTYESDTKVRLISSGEPHASVNMVRSIEEVNVDGKKRKKWYVWYAVLRNISYDKFSKTLEVLRTFHRLFVWNKKQSTYR